MKKFLIAMGVAAFTFVGCDDSSSASAGSNDEPAVESSSSVEQGSSSSEKAKPSSSVIASETKQSNSSSSVDPISSSSLQGDKKSSSSGEKETSSSSVKSESSSSAGEVNCSALLEGETGWSWNVPKECRFNPDIDYGSMTDTRDGEVYKTVKIGNQTWMAENLNYADSAKTPSLKGKSWCFGNDSLKCKVTGRFYTWAAAIDSAKLYTDKSIDCGYGKTSTLPDTVYGICPPGWHLPNNTEWNALFTAVGGQSTAGKVLKSQSGWVSHGNGTDAFGFSALPAGFRNNYNGYFYDVGNFAYFWSSTESSSYNAYFIDLNYYNEDGYLNYGDKGYGYSVRCLKD